MTNQPTAYKMRYLCISGPDWLDVEFTLVLGVCQFTKRSYNIPTTQILQNYYHTKADK